MGEKKRRLARQATESAQPDERPPPRVRRLMDAGLQALRDRQLPDAIKAYREAAALAPSLADARHYLGLALLEFGQRSEGLELVRQSLTAHPDNPAYHFNLAAALRSYDLPAATRALARSIELAPSDVGYTLAYADALLRQGLRDAGIAALERAATLDPARAAIHRHLAELLFTTDRLESAPEHHQRAIALEPQLAKTWRMGYALPRQDHLEREARLVDVLRFDTADSAALRLAERCDLHVVDDFLEDPVDYRRAALALPYRSVLYSGQNFPGIQTEGRLEQQLMTRIATVLGHRIKFDSPDNGSFRVSYGESTARADIHVDNDRPDLGAAYAAVLYLNPPDQCVGGTTFWKHRATGWDKCPTPAELKAAGYADYRAFGQRWLPPLAKDEEFNLIRQRRQDAWQAVIEVPMRCNRLIIYMGHFFHSISSVFGNETANGRLVQLFYFWLDPVGVRVP